MNVIPGIVRCRQCEAVLGSQPWSMCLLCGGVFCATHLMERKGVVTCGDCHRALLAREAASAVTEANEARVVALLLKDMTSTIEQVVEHIVVESAARNRLFVDNRDHYEQTVVDDVQQRLHDEFVDTTWPTCPIHRTHPLWFSGGKWRCERTGQVLAGLGELDGASKRG